MNKVFKTKVIAQSNKKIILSDFEFEFKNVKGIIRTEKEGFTDVILPGGIFTIQEDYIKISNIYNKQKQK